MRRGLRIARRHTDRYPGAVPLRTAGRNSGRIRRVAPGPMRRGLRIAIGGMQSGPRAVVFTGQVRCSAVREAGSSLADLLSDIAMLREHRMRSLSHYRTGRAYTGEHG
jgi:hypothetical protein